MIKLPTFLRAAALWMILGGSLAHANLIVNPGFELGTSGWWFDGDVEVRDGYSHTGSRSAAFDCNVFSCFPAEQSGGMIFQPFETEIGQTYSVEFWLTTDGFESFLADGGFFAQWDATVLLTLNEDVEFQTPGTWVHYSFSIDAADTTTTLMIYTPQMFRGAIFIDDISVELQTPELQTPEPAASLLIFGGLAPLIALKRRRTGRAGGRAGGGAPSGHDRHFAEPGGVSGDRAAPGA